MTSPDTSHTPGPWEACDPGDYGDFDGESRVILGDDRRIAVVHWSPRLNTAQSDANARLIAAAPDLLAKLSEVLDFYDALSSEHAPGEVELLDSITALLAKHTRPTPTKDSSHGY